MREFKIITSRENSLIKLISSLQGSANARREHRLFALEGLRLCDDAYQNGIRFDKLIVSDGAFEKYRDTVYEFAENSGDCFKIPDTLFKKIADTSAPQGILALSALPKTDGAEIKPDGRYVALENISDPSNLGAVSRTAEALGVSGIILSSGGCDPYSPKSLRASMGTLLRMPITVLEDFPSRVGSLGLKTYGCVVESTAEPITKQHFEDGSIVIIGNEANGLTEQIKAAADCLITVPMSGKAESLNAAVAAAISMWEMMKS